MEIDWTTGAIPTSHGTGPFHPAIRNGNQVLYWPNITFGSEDEAYNFAVRSLADALQPTADIIKDWNIWIV